jgi:hypothetical protein
LIQNKNLSVKRKLGEGRNMIVLGTYELNGPYCSDLGKARSGLLGMASGERNKRCFDTENRLEVVQYCGRETIR